MTIAFRCASCNVASLAKGHYIRSLEGAALSTGLADRHTHPEQRVPVLFILNHSFQLKHEPSSHCSASTLVSFPVTSNTVDSVRGKSREGR